MRLRCCLSKITAVAFCLAGAAVAEEPVSEYQSLPDAISGGKLLLNLRARYEFVDQDGKAEKADAYTLRTLFGWQTGAFHGWSVLLQGIDVSRLGSKDYNDAPSQAAASPFPLVPDPHTTDVNQAYLQYAGLWDTTVRAGRQSIKLDNVRFVGNVEFRQVMQVFNGVTLENKALKDTDVYLGYLGRVRSTLGTERSSDIGIVHAAYSISPTETVTGYGYFENDPHLASVAAKDLSNRTLGLRLDGAHALGSDFKLLYTAEYASQHSYANGDARIDADYEHFGAGPRWGDWYVRFDYEKLGSNGGTYAFQTPLGTNHLFQGWADLFLTTPAQGIRDSYLTLGGKIGSVQVYAELHKYKSDFGSIDFGKEFDASFAYRFMKPLLGKLEYASYREGDVLSPASARKRNTSKIWVTLLYEY
jgi:Alginate export